jgi:hypothetical protein
MPDDSSQPRKRLRRDTEALWSRLRHYTGGAPPLLPRTPAVLTAAAQDWCDDLRALLPSSTAGADDNASQQAARETAITGMAIAAAAAVQNAPAHSRGEAAAAEVWRRCAECCLQLLPADAAAPVRCAAAAGLHVLGPPPRGREGGRNGSSSSFAARFHVSAMRKLQLAACADASADVREAAAKALGRVVSRGGGDGGGGAGGGDGSSLMQAVVKALTLRVRSPFLVARAVLPADACTVAAPAEGCDGTERGGEESEMTRLAVLKCLGKLGRAVQRCWHELPAAAREVSAAMTGSLWRPGMNSCVHSRSSGSSRSAVPVCTHCQGLTGALERASWAVAEQLCVEPSADWRASAASVLARLCCPAAAHPPLAAAVAAGGRGGVGEGGRVTEMLLRLAVGAHEGVQVSHNVRHQWLAVLANSSGL